MFWESFWSSSVRPKANFHTLSRTTSTSSANLSFRFSHPIAIVDKYDMCFLKPSKVLYLHINYTYL